MVLLLAESVAAMASVVEGRSSGVKNVLWSVVEPPLDANYRIGFLIRNMRACFYPTWREKSLLSNLAPLNGRVTLVRGGRTREHPEQREHGDVRTAGTACQSTFVLPSDMYPTVSCHSVRRPVTRFANRRMMIEKHQMARTGPCRSLFCLVGRSHSGSSISRCSSLIECCP